MNISHSLIPVFWLAVILAMLAGTGLGAGITLLLSTVSHRKVALPLVWISAATLVAGATAVIVILTH